MFKNNIHGKDRVFSHPDEVSGVLQIKPEKKHITDTLIICMSFQGQKQTKKFLHTNFLCSQIYGGACTTIPWTFAVPQHIQLESSFQAYSTFLEAMQRYKKYKSGANPLLRVPSTLSTDSVNSNVSVLTDFQAYKCEARDFSCYDPCECHRDLPPSVEFNITYAIVTELYSYNSGRFLSRIVNYIIIKNNNQLVSPSINSTINDPFYYYKCSHIFDGRVAYRLKNMNKPRGMTLVVPVPEVVQKKRFTLTVHSPSRKAKLTIGKICLKCHLYDSIFCHVGNPIMKGAVKEKWDLKMIETVRMVTKFGCTTNVIVELPSSIEPTFHHCLTTRTYSLTAEISKSWLYSAVEITIPVTIGVIKEPSKKLHLPLDDGRISVSSFDLPNTQICV